MYCQEFFMPTNSKTVKQNKNKDSEPIRLNHYLAIKKIATRRGADKLIESGVILVNGKVATIGMKVTDNDDVKVLKDTASEYKYIAYHKPVGIVTVGPNPGERAIPVKDFGEGMFPIGRLDKDSHGLIIITNDGRVTGALLDPKKNHDKEYRITVSKPVTNNLLRGMKEGIRIGAGVNTRKALVRKIDPHTLEIVLTEGKNRQIRRMAMAYGFEVSELLRFRIMNIELGNLKPGQHRSIMGAELETFLKQLGLK